MYLIEQKADGKRFAATPNDIHSYSKALTDAEDNLRRNPDTVALYPYKDGGSSVVRTYIRATRPPFRAAEVLFGLHEWPAPPTVFPGRLPTWDEELYCAEFQSRSRLYRHQWHGFDFVVWDEGHTFKPALNMGKTAYAEAMKRIAEPRFAGYTLSDIHKLRRDNLILAGENMRFAEELSAARQDLVAAEEKRDQWKRAYDAKWFALEALRSAIRALVKL